MAVARIDLAWKCCRALAGSARVSAGELELELGTNHSAVSLPRVVPPRSERRQVAAVIATAAAMAGVGECQRKPGGRAYHPHLQWQPRFLSVSLEVTRTDQNFARLKF